MKSNITSTGWSVSYILDVRGGGKNSGYVSSGFFGGKFSLCASGQVLTLLPRSYYRTCRAFMA